jgi:hypothetical protein
MNKDYLGGGVYVELEPGMLKLTTENGCSEATNTIYLEPEVLAALLRYVERVKATYQGIM